jgi:hypothetical protein
MRTLPDVVAGGMRAVRGHNGLHEYPGHARYRAWMPIMAGTPATW